MLSYGVWVKEPIYLFGSFYFAFIKVRGLTADIIISGSTGVYYE